MNTKKFITDLGFSKEMTTFLLNDNIVDFTILNIEKKKGGIFHFQTITDFHKIENHELDKNGLKALELFQNFRTSKNAIACILKAIETKGAINAETFKNQSKITPATYTDKEKALKTFGQLWATLTNDQKAIYGDIASEWMVAEGLELTNLEFFHINGDHGKTFEKGQYLRMADSVYGQRLFAVVIQASPKGFISATDGEEIFTLSAESAKRCEIIASEQLTPEAREFFTATMKELAEESAERKTAKLEAGAKAHERNAKIAEAEQAKAEKIELANKAKEAKSKASAEELNALKSLSMTTKEEVDAVVKKINLSTALLPEHKKDLAETIKNVKATFKKQAETIKEPATETAPAGETPKATNRPKRNPQTIEEIIKEDAQSENPIL